MPLFPRRFVAALLAISLCLFVCVPAGLAISPSELGASPPEELILDDADVFSRASRNELDSKLKGISFSKPGISSHAARHLGSQAT